MHRLISCVLMSSAASLAASESCVAPAFVDTLVIGNGPSGIATSFFLQGNSPVFTGQHLDPTIQSTLAQGPLAEQSLEQVSQQLRGRSNNPSALLFDVLLHPAADSPHKAESSLEFVHNSSATVDHLVLGHDRPGGSWHEMLGSTSSLSPGYWMELPGLRLASHLNTHQSEISSRIPRGLIADYYTEYVNTVGLSDRFLSGWTVSSLTAVAPTANSTARYKVHATNPGQPDMSIQARNVVLATGSFANPRKLQISGEQHTQIVKHRSREIEIRVGSKLLVVGAGLSASDLIVNALKEGMSVVHVFRTDVAGTKVKKMFGEYSSMYPEYYALTSLMEGTQQHEGYQALPRSQLSSIDEEGNCEIVDAAGVMHQQAVDQVAIMIGADPDLEFIDPEIRRLLTVETEAEQFFNGVKATHKVYVDVDPHTMEVKRSPGLFAIGPLRGDNFVRFLSGDGFFVAQRVAETKV